MQCSRVDHARWAGLAVGSDVGVAVEQIVVAAGPFEVGEQPLVVAVDESKLLVLDLQVAEVSCSVAPIDSILSSRLSLSQSQLPKTKWASNPRNSSTTGGSSMSPQCSTV